MVYPTHASEPLVVKSSGTDVTTSLKTASEVRKPLGTCDRNVSLALSDGSVARPGSADVKELLAQLADSVAPEQR